MEACFISTAGTRGIYIRWGGNLFLLAVWHLPITRTEPQCCNYSPLDLTGRPNTRGLLTQTQRCRWDDCDYEWAGTLSQCWHKVTIGGRSLAQYIQDDKLQYSFWKMAKDAISLLREHFVMAANFGKKHSPLDRHYNLIKEFFCRLMGNTAQKLDV